MSHTDRSELSQGSMKSTTIIIIGVIIIMLVGQNVIIMPAGIKKSALDEDAHHHHHHHYDHNNNKKMRRYKKVKPDHANLSNTKKSLVHKTMNILLLIDTRVWTHKHTRIPPNEKKIATHHCNYGCCRANIILNTVTEYRNNTRTSTPNHKTVSGVLYIYQLPYVPPNAKEKKKKKTSRASTLIMLCFNNYERPPAVMEDPGEAEFFFAPGLRLLPPPMSKPLPP